MHSIFIGNSYLNPLTDPKNCAVFMANVTFEPGCRNNWHIHHAAKGGGQLLICTAGEGWYQEEGKEAFEKRFFIFQMPLLESQITYKV